MSERMRQRTVLVQIPQQPQRQDSTTSQLRDVLWAAERLGCYDAADLIRRTIKTEEAPHEL